MSDYEELYEEARTRADMCEGIIMELRRQNAELQSKLEQSERGERHAWDRVATVVKEREALKKERRLLRKRLEALAP